MEKASYYKAFVAQTPEEILQSVLKKEKAVLLAISLNNGMYIEGFLLDVAESNHQKAVCLLSKDEQVSFFYAHNIALITVIQPTKMLVELSKGAISRPLLTDGKDFTVLQLKRWLNSEKDEFGSHIKEFNTDNIPLDQLNNRLNLQDVVRALKIAIVQITKDELGQEVWQVIDTIVLQQSEKLQLSIQAKTLTISVAIDRVLPEKLALIIEENLLKIL